MKRYLPASSMLTIAAVAAVWLAASPAAAQGDRGPKAAANAAAGDRTAVGADGRGAGGGGSTASGGGSSTASSGGASGSSGGGSYTGGSETGRARAADRGAGGQGATGGGGYAVPRERGDGRRSISRDGGADRADGAPSGVPSYARPRDGKDAVGTAVPRGSVAGGNAPIVIRSGGYYGGYYDPWWYEPGYVGAYGGYYDPWYGGYPSYPQGTYSSSSYQEEGKLRLKIKPREAEVYVDGYYAGVVDNFDGVFQRLHLETGAHRIEVRAPGYETLEINVRIALDQTTTYEGELKKIP